MSLFSGAAFVPTVGQNSLTVRVTFPSDAKEERRQRGNETFERERDGEGCLFTVKTSVIEPLNSCVVMLPYRCSSALILCNKWRSASSDRCGASLDLQDYCASA